MRRISASLEKSLDCKAAEADAEKYAEAISKVVEGLQGDAFTVAKEGGLKSLWQIGSAGDDSDDPVPSGVDALIEAMRSSVFPLTTHEAKELFRQYCKPSGALSRQNGDRVEDEAHTRTKANWSQLSPTELWGL